ncbi:MAG: hypothetical protein BWY68_00120 [bacterium ADurb.Bin400]|nr:MAG: hypothetical protein BWY68_00120 [bacterium ADurb.Bin400]
MLKVLNGLTAIRLTRKQKRKSTAALPPVLKQDLGFPQLYGALLQVITPSGIQASNSHLFKGAIFGRDSLRVALDLLPRYPSVSELAITSLARLQGSKSNTLNEEEPGKIPHEYRNLFVGSEKVQQEQQAIMKTLAKQWGWSEHERELCYYGSVDATPQFIRLVCLFRRQYGDEILNKEVLHRNGNLISIKDSVLAAARWTAAKIEESEICLLEFQQSHPESLKWQVMRDGSTAYLHPDGTLANVGAPIASFEVQGLAYDALAMAAELFIQERPTEVDQWLSLAKKLQASTLQLFWMEREQFFAMAVDRDNNRRIRQLKTITSVPSEVLETSLFDTIEHDQRVRYVEAITRKLYSPDFLTEAGIRSRALRHFGAIDYYDYQGSGVSWPVMTNAFALGLRKQGLCRLARDLENRIINAANVSGSLNEFFYVTPDGRVNYQPVGASHEHESEHEVIYGTSIPEHIQAWTVSAVLRAKLTQSENNEELANNDYARLESELLLQHGVQLLETHEVCDVSSRRCRFLINQTEAQRREIALLQREGHIT